MKKSTSVLLMVAILLLSHSSRADSGKPDPCLLQGYVTDAVTRKPVAGVLVSATSKISSGSCEVTTDADGFFRFSQLPSSQVNLQFDKRGYQLYKRSGVQVSEKTTLKINVEFNREEVDPREEEPDNLFIRMLEIN
ncbi:MAG TPA: carboxypeptidase-like regulatory domain-containing protein [Puia sp.]|nr:carboxypeptidase-like regulatory domain-containing protein [Puia sp.]